MTLRPRPRDRWAGSLSRLDLPDGGMKYLALCRDGAGLLGASYGGGYGISCPVANGVVGDAVSRIEFPNLHSVLPSADSRFAYFVSLGADLVAQYALTEDLRLVALEPATVAAPEGSGPRHLVMNEAQDAVYVLTEFSAQVLHFVRDTETETLELRDAAHAFDPRRDCPTAGSGPIPAQSTSSGVPTCSSATAPPPVVSERTESTLGAVSVGDDGRCRPRAFRGDRAEPRGFALSPDGAHLIAAGEGSTTVSLYAVQDDSLELLQRAETGRGANWVRFV